jgi:hypothetical protein
MNIRYIKLMNGEELYAEVIDTTEHNIVVKNPLTLKTQYDPQLGPYMSISEWIISSKIKIYTLNKNHIIVHCSVDNRIEEQYIDYFNTDKPSADTNKPSDTFIIIPEDTNTH